MFFVVGFLIRTRIAFSYCIRHVRDFRFPGEFAKIPPRPCFWIFERGVWEGGGRWLRTRDKSRYVAFYTATNLVQRYYSRRNNIAECGDGSAKVIPPLHTNIGNRIIQELPYTYVSDTITLGTVKISVYNNVDG